MDLGTIESSFVDSSLTKPFVEDSKVTCFSAKVTCIGSFLLNMILMLLFLGEMILSWIYNCLLAFFCCSSYICICMYNACAFEPDSSFHTFSSLYKPSSLFSLLLSLVSFYLQEMFPKCLYLAHFPFIMHTFVPHAWN